MHRISRHIVAAAVFLIAAVTVSAIPARPVPERLVNDFAGILDFQQKTGLELMLDIFSDTTSNQIAVVTVDDLEGYSPAEYGTEIGLEWGVGSSKFDNGIVVLVKPKTPESDGQVNISVGYGLEGAIPDSYAKRIIENEMIPAFSQGNYYEGIYRACEVLMKLASGEISEPYPEEGDGGSMAAVLFTIILLFIIAFIISRKSGGNHGGGSGNGKSRKIHDKGDFVKGLIIGSLLSEGSGNRGGNWSGFGGGGFSGGGFSGGGFGGFGGGSFGGGGASGSW